MSGTSLDALLGTISKDGVELELGSGLNFTGSVTVVRNAVSGKIDIAIAGGGGAGHTIEDEGTPLTARTSLNFVGSNVSVADAGGKTVVTVGGPSTAYVDAADAALAATIPAAGSAPANVTKAAAAAGVASTFSRSDHKHDVTTAAPGSIALSTTAAAEGAATSLARSDHQHSVAAGTGAGQQPFWDGAAWRLLGLLTGTDLTDANQTLAIAGGAQYFLKGALTASREKRLSLTGVEADLMLTIHSWATRAFTMVVKDDASGAVLHTFPASAQPYVVTFIVNKAGTAWERSGHGPLGPVV
jgi:hypothetical protein